MEDIKHAVLVFQLQERELMKEGKIINNYKYK